MTLSGATTPGLSGPGNDWNKGVLRITQRSRFTWAPLLDCLVLHPGLSLEKSYSSAEMPSMYSEAPVEWAQIIPPKRGSEKHKWIECI